MFSRKEKRKEKKNLCCIMFCCYRWSSLKTHKIILRYLIQFGFENPISQANLSISKDGNMIFFSPTAQFAQSNATKKKKKSVGTHVQGTLHVQFFPAECYQMKKQTDNSTKARTRIRKPNGIVKTSSLPKFRHARTKTSHRDGHMIDEHTTVELLPLHPY